MNYGSVSINTTDKEEVDEEEDPWKMLKRQESPDSHQSNVSTVVSLLEAVKFENDEEAWAQDLGGTATIFAETMNLTKNLLGAGVLSMSGGIALYANNPWAVWNGCFWIVLQAAIFGYFCILIAKICKFTESRTIRQCWERTMGNRYAVAVVIVIGLNPCQGTLAYSAILSQTFQSLCQSIGIEFTHVESLLLVTIVALLPLCLMKNIHALAPFSILGTASVLLTACGMIYRCLDGSYRPGGKFYDDLPPNMTPLFGDHYAPWSPTVMPLVCMIFEAYVMHYNSPRFYRELKSTSIPRYSLCVGSGFGLAALVYVAIASAGFLTFGGHSNNYILNNYSPRDPLATICRLLIGISVITIYPIAFIGFRDSVLDVLHVPIEQQTTTYLNSLTVIMLSLITLIAVFVTDLGVINSVGGGTVAVAMVFVFPLLMFQKAIGNLGFAATKGQRLEVKIAAILAFSGCLIGIVGVGTELYLGVA